MRPCLSAFKQGSCQHVYFMLSDMWHAQVFLPPGPARRMQWRRCSRACRNGMGRTTGLTPCAPGARSCCGIPASTTAKRVDPPTMAAGQSLRETLDVAVILLAMLLQLDTDLPICISVQSFAEHQVPSFTCLVTSEQSQMQGLVCCPMACQLRHNKSSCELPCCMLQSGDPDRDTLLSLHIAVWSQSEYCSCRRLLSVCTPLLVYDQVYIVELRWLIWVQAIDQGTAVECPGAWPGL